MASQFVNNAISSVSRYHDDAISFLVYLSLSILRYLLFVAGWAVSLSAAEGEWIYDFCFFSVVIMLTDAGHDHVEDIIGLLFRYILLLQNSGVKEWIFNELVAICEMGFHFQDKISPVLYATNIASNMQQYPPEDWLVASSFPSKFDPNIIQMVLGQLTARNVRIFWESKKFEGHFKLVEPWYCTPYSIEKISASLVQQWVEKAPNEPLHLPAINKFIPTDLSIKNVQNQVKFPILLRSCSFARLWYKPDTIFHTPKACVRLDFICPLSNNSPEAEALTDIFTRLLTDSLNEFAYDARVAGLYYGIYCTETGFQIAVGGYNAKMKPLLEEIVGKIAKFEVKAERFSVIKETVMKDYQNFKFQQPYEQALYYRSLLLSEKTWPLSETLDVLPQLEVDHLVKFIPQILSKVFLEGFVTGNVEASEAESILKYIEGIFFEGPHPISTPLFPSQHLADRTIKLQKGVRYYHPVNAQNQNEENSALVHYVQIHRDEIKLNVKLQLFALIASQPAYDQLRSVEQLGYVVVLMERNDAGIWGLQIIIQSSVKNPPDLDSRVEAFLKNFENTLCEMTVEEYKSNVNALINMKLEKYKNLWEESSFYWGEIADGTLRFDRKESEAAALRDLTHQELMEFFEEHIKVGALKRKTLCVQVSGGQHSEYRKAKSDPSQPTNVRIDDICNFRRSMPLYGSFKGVFAQMKL